MPPVIPSAVIATRVTPRSAGETLDAWRDWSTAIGEDLFDLDADPSTALLGNDPDRYSGRTAELVGTATSDLADLWGVWNEIRSRLERMRELIDAGQVAEAASLFPLVATVGSRSFDSVRSMATWLEEAIPRIRSVAGDLAAALVESGAHLEAARTAISVMEERALGLGLRADADLVDARRVLTRSEQLAATDPLAFDPASLEDVVRRARSRLDEATAERDAIDQRLHDGLGLITRLAALIPEGAAALERTRGKILDPVGLLQPLDAASVLDDPRSGLRPWLTRIRGAHDRGELRPVLAGLDRWETVAGAHLANAIAVRDANAGPLRRRDELRGLLAALRARAAAGGLAEDATATELHRAAREALYVAPCPLALAEERVEAYRRHVLEDGVT